MAKCADEECTKEIKDHKWAKIRAQDDGWFLKKGGEVYCPAHIPEWVDAWRDRKDRK